MARPKRRGWRLQAAALLLYLVIALSIAAAAAGRPRTSSTSAAFLLPLVHPRPITAPYPQPPRQLHSSASSSSSSLDMEERVAEVERILDAYLYPAAAADARKTLAFASQDRFLGPHGERRDAGADDDAIAESL